MKVIWKGSLSFGLVNIPVRLYSAIERQKTGFRLLHQECGTPLKYRRWCTNCNKEASWQKTTKGIEIRKNKFFMISKDQIEKLRPEKTETIDIIAFIGSHQISQPHLDSHYYLAPDKATEKAYFLFREVLRSAAKVALGRFVIKDKEHICAISAHRNGMLLTTLNYSHEVRDINQIKELEKDPKLEKKEMQLAHELMERLYEDSFDISSFRDTFSEKLREIVRRMEKGEKIEVKKEGKKERKTLIEALRASIREK
ncbi:Ku protein [Candidatus Woesearchaeota archaeon]|nr:Ku protein [Candidatus Woesearchaeota archaeon]